MDKNGKETSGNRGGGAQQWRSEMSLLRPGGQQVAHPDQMGLVPKFIGLFHPPVGGYHPIQKLCGAKIHELPIDVYFKTRQ